YEKAATWRPLGAGIVMPANAMQILARLGLADGVRKAGNLIECMEIRDARDRLIRATDLRSSTGRLPAPPIALRRSDLHSILLSALPRDLVLLNQECQAVRWEEGRLTLSFARSEDAAISPDLVIGAEGIHSVLRRQLFPEARKRYSGQSSYRAL